MRAKDLLGQQGEELAARYLAGAGLQILARNWRCKDGEIDIVALDQRVLVVCEVKTRSGVGFGTPLEAVTRQKAWRLRRLAVRWITDRGLTFEQIRIDVVGVLRTGPGEFNIEHVPGGGLDGARTYSIAPAGGFRAVGACPLRSRGALGTAS